MMLTIPADMMSATEPTVLAIVDPVIVGLERQKIIDGTATQDDAWGPPAWLVEARDARCPDCEGTGLSHFDHEPPACENLPGCACGHPDCVDGRIPIDVQVPCADLNDLRHGETITVTWSGGNGPHEYRVNRDGSDVYAVSGEPLDETNHTWTYNPLTFVGTERYHTRITVTRRVVVHDIVPINPKAMGPIAPYIYGPPHLEALEAMYGPTDTWVGRFALIGAPA